MPFRCQNFFLNVACPSTSRSYHTVWLFGVVEYKYANFSTFLLCVSLTFFQFTDICVCCHIYSCSVAFICSCYFCLWRSTLNWAYAHSYLRFQYHTQLEKHTHIRLESSERMISSSHTQHTMNTRNEHPCPQGDSNEWSQQTAGRRP